MKAIVGVNNLSYIGFNGGLPWKCKPDLLLFKQLTSISHKNNVEPKILVGYNTSLTLPDLKGRDVKKTDLKESDINDIDWCIGGKKTYEKYCHLFTELHISHIDDNTIGDVMFPDLKGLSPDCNIFQYYFNVDKEMNEYDVIFEDVKETFKDVPDECYEVDDNKLFPLNRVCLLKDNDSYYVDVTIEGVEMSPTFNSNNLEVAYKFFYKKVKELGLYFTSLF